jgi:thiol:disulfide interchange protein DsbA
VTWQVNGITGGNATVGTISSSGVYQAPTSVPSPAVVTVSAISVANSTRSGSAQVTVTGSSGGSSSGSGGGGGGGGGAMGWPLLLLAALALPAVAARRRPRMRGGALLAMTLALLGASAGAHADSRWVAGQHYFLINPPQPTGLPAGKVQVIEIFSYACPGCNRFYPVADRLRASLPPYAVMEYLAASFRPDEDWPMFQRAYVTAQQMGIDERTHDAMFDAVWKSGELAVFDPATQHARHPPPSIADAAQFYAKAAGVKPEAFLATAGSFGVDVKVREADERIRNYAIGETPSIVVNGKYRLNPVSAGGYEETIDLVKWLVSQEAPPGSKH